MAGSRGFSLFCTLLVLGFGLSIGATSAIAADNHLSRIQNSGEVRVCIWPDYYGISYRNPKTQRLSGVDYEMALALGQDIGAKVRFIDSSFAKLVDDVVSDRCDIAMFAVGITSQRAEKLRFTRPHLRSDVYGITTRSNQRIKSWNDIDQPGVVVAVAKGTFHEPVMREKLKKATLLVTNTTFEREQEVESGRADVFMTDFPYSRRMLDHADWARLVSPPGVYHEVAYAYAMKPGDDAWHTRLEQFMNDIKRDGRLLAAARRYGLESIVVSSD